MKQLLFALLFLIIGLKLQAQNLSGVVLDATTQTPLNHATIRLNQSRQVFLSDANGNFHFQLNNKDTLVVSFIGYQSRRIGLNPAASTRLTIELQPISQMMNDVIVSTGYQTLSKERATGSFTQLDEKALNTSVSTDILSRLNGIANGVSFDSRTPDNPMISIRGLSTIYGNAQPLIVLNNFPYDGDINTINPNDVQSITILKDAAAASIWGVRAANGVIVINTKKGALNRPAQVSVNANVTVGHKPDVFSIPMMSSKDFIGVEQYLFQNGFYKAAETNPSHPPLTPVVELLIAQRDGKITSDQLNQQLNALSQLDVRNDFNKYLYQNSLNQQYAVNLNGGDDKTTYYDALGYDHNSDNLAAIYERLSFKADHTIQLGKLKLNPMFNYARSVATTGRLGYNSITPGVSKGLYPYAQLADASGNPLSIVKDYRASFVNTAQANGLLNWNYVPLDEGQERKQTNTINNLTAGLNADYAILPKLIAQLQYQYQYQDGKIYNLNSIDSYYTRNLINSFTQNDGSGNLSYPIPIGGILKTNNTGVTANSGRFQMNYHNEWQKNELTALAGTEVKEIRNTGASFTTYGFDPNGLTSIPINYTTYYPQYYNHGSHQGIPYNAYFSDATNRYTSYYANLSYSYDQRYTVSASARKDASNLFGVKSNQRGVPLWSGGLSWNINKEHFYPDGFLNYLKLRLTYGFNGNLPENVTAVASLLNTTGNLNNQPYDIVYTYPNPGLSWEKVGVFNFGLDFGSRKGEISGSIEYYHKSGSDLIGYQPIDPTVGITYGEVTRNVADMASNGIDFQINSRNLNSALKWQTAFILNYNRDRVTSYVNESDAASNYLTSGFGVSPIVGKPLYNIFVYKWAGLDPKNGNPMGLVNGKPSEDYSAIVYNTKLSELDYKGPALPPFYGSLSNTLDYKHFSLYVNVTYRLGYYFVRKSISYYLLYNQWYGNKDFANRWQKPGDEAHTNVPSMPTIANNSYQRDYFYSNSSPLVERADNIRLQEVNLSYAPNIPGLKRLHIHDLQFYVDSRNLGILWRANKYGLDPDTGSNYLPQSYTISFGCKAKF